MEAQKELTQTQTYSEQYYFVLQEWEKIAKKEVTKAKSKKDILALRPLLPPEQPEIPVYLIRRLAPFYGHN